MNTVRIEIAVGRTTHTELYGPEFHIEAHQRVEYTQAQPIKQIGGGRLLKNLLGLVCRGCKRIDQILAKKHLEIPVCEACGEPIEGRVVTNSHHPSRRGDGCYCDPCWALCINWKDWKKYLT